ncbi:MAG: hypothetical protein DRR00_11115 [Candidatus Parabeggiatoa sp. nov. 3]|nr:MAG: hypothetical protein DRR00_11115 [Gammaproteobacteria bacterium]RKZ56306.1 MAG: hypothetical protein DRQ99_28725 [Gammaproteobacteria bacterium]
MTSAVKRKSKDHLATLKRGNLVFQWYGNFRFTALGLKTITQVKGPLQTKRGSKNARNENGILGNGAMGSALARAFLANKHTVTVWNRTASKCVPLEQAGAKVAHSVAEAAQASDVIVANVLNYTVSHALLQTPEVVNQLKGKVLVQLATGIPSEAREMETWAKQNGISYLDGAILDYPKGIGTKECLIIYAGPEAVFEANQSLLLL